MPACFRVAISSGAKPHSTSAVSVSVPAATGARWTSLGVRSKRGAGAGWGAPSTSTNVLARDVVRVRARLAHREHRREADLVPAKNSTHSSRVRVAEERGEALLELRPLGTVHLLRGIEVVELRGAREQVGVELRLVRRDRHVLAVGRLVHVVEVRAAVEEVGAAVAPAAHRVDAEEDAHELRAAVDHRGVDDLPLGRTSPARRARRGCPSRRARRRRRSRRAG